MSKIMLVGGGSGGHLTPLISVATAIKQIDPSTIVIDVGQRGENLSEVTNHQSIDEWYSIYAGKFRRYHGESFVSHLLDVKTLLLNIRDLFRFLAGTVQAYRLLGKVKPDSIMLKGGFVCVPVGLAARLRKIPYLTHDSDAVPGLANRLTAKKAVYNTTALPANLYPYPEEKTMQVGIPIQPEYSYVSDEDKANAKRNLGIEKDAPVVLVAGGGLGAQNVNNSILEASNELIKNVENIVIIHITGKKLHSAVKTSYESILDTQQIKQIMLLDFTTELYKYSSSADLVVTRAGATSIAEFAVQAKPCIVIPNPVLTGGQQLHNAKVLADKEASYILDDNKAKQELAGVIQSLIKDKDALKKYGSNLHSLAQENSAEKIAQLLINMSAGK